jgi:hypothetical protein
LLCCGGNASAVRIFFDDFNRANNATVGNGWQEAGSVLLFDGNATLTAIEQGTRHYQQSA